MKRGSVTAVILCLAAHTRAVQAFSPASLLSRSSSLTPRSSPSRSSSSALRAQKEDPKFELHTEEQLDTYFDESNDLFRTKGGNQIDYKARLKAAHVEGDTQLIGSPNLLNSTHPVVQLLHHRRKTKTTTKDDGFKVALSVEGGGMRGCLSGGMVAAIYYLGLEDSVDVVYGSSAGGVIGSYFVTRQLQWFGPEIYYDSLTTAGKEFIDTKGLFRALGIGALNPNLWSDFVKMPQFGKPVLNLDYLFKRTMQESKPLDWEKLVAQQHRLPLKIVASNLRDEKAIVMDMEKGSFSSLAELTQCMHASCLLPGIAGPLMNIDDATGDMMLGNRQKDAIPLADALLYEPMPFRSAIEEGATHVVVLRTRPDGADVTGQSSIFERMMLRRFFKRKNTLPNILAYMKKGLHKMQYGKDVLALNAMAKDMDRSYTDTSEPHVMTVAVPPGSPEVERLEARRSAIFDGVRRGFARAYDALVEDPAERGRGAIVAMEYFPDEILNYDPLTISSQKESAFEIHLRKKGEDPEDWKAKLSYVTDVER